MVESSAKHKQVSIKRFTDSNRKKVEDDGVYKKKQFHIQLCTPEWLVSHINRNTRNSTKSIFLDKLHIGEV